MESMHRRLKKIAVTFVCMASCYFGILPLFWPCPKATAELPREHPYDEDLSIRIEVFAWHKNVMIRQVRFYVDYQQTTAHGPEGPFYTTSLFHSGKQTRRWPFFTVNRFTWPRSRKLDLILPLKRLAREGVVRTGVVRGKLDISIATPSLPGNLATWLGYITRERTQHVPFALHLVDHLEGESPAGGYVIGTWEAGDRTKSTTIKFNDPPPNWALQLPLLGGSEQW